MLLAFTYQKVTKAFSLYLPTLHGIFPKIYLLTNAKKNNLIWSNHIKIIYQFKFLITSKLQLFTALLLYSSSSWSYNLSSIIFPVGFFLPTSMMHSLKVRAPLSSYIQTIFVLIEYRFNSNYLWQIAAVTMHSSFFSF